MNASFRQPKGNPVDYWVPNFGVDSDIIDAQQHIADAETLLKHTWTPTQDKNGFWNTPGPSVSRLSNLIQTDAYVQVESDPICSSAGCNYPSEKAAAAAVSAEYDIPNFGADHNVRQTHESLDWAENNLRHRWILSADDLKKKKPDAEYTVPNFGVDEDILWTQKNIENASKDLKHEWKPVQDENGVWGLPSAADNHSYTYKQ